MGLELIEIEKDEYIQLVNNNSCALGIVFNRYSKNVIAFEYIREGIKQYYKIKESE